MSLICNDGGKYCNIIHGPRLNRSGQAFTLLRFYAFTLLRFYASTLRRFDASTLRRFDASTPRRLDASTPRRLDASTPRRLDASTPRRLDASTLRRFYASTLLRFYAFTFTWWFQDSLPFMFTPPKCFAALCRCCPRLVVLCVAFPCFDLGVWSMARDSLWSWLS